MSVETLAVVLHHSRAKGTRKLVLLGIANHDGDGGAWPTVRTLARYANADRRTVQRAVEWLVTQGELTVDLQAGGPRDMDDDDRPNRYQVLVTCPSWCDRTRHHRDTRGRPERLGITVDEGAAPTPPPTPGGGGTHAAPPGGTHAALTVHRTTTPPSPPPNPHPCQVCGQGQARCLAAQVNWAPADRHPYSPLHTLHAIASTPSATATRRRRRTP